MKLIIQIPCYNEASYLPGTLTNLPRNVTGFDKVEWLVIDDGSDDNTAEIARQHKVDHVIRLPAHRGLAFAFAKGIESALALRADVIVNTDADNQYCAEDITKLVEPILIDKADIVIGARPIDNISHFSLIKKILQRLGSRVVRLLSGTKITDATSGFRAFSKMAALEINVFSSYTYTLETIIQAGQRGLRIVSVPIRVNPMLRPSRLISSSMNYVWRSMLTMLHVFLIYRPFRFFFVPAFFSFIVGTAIAMRFLYFFLTSDGTGHVQSLILSAILIISAGLLFIAGIIADLLSINRRLLEDIQLHERRKQ